MPSSNSIKNFWTPLINPSHSAKIGKRKNMISGILDPAIVKITTQDLSTSLNKHLNLSRICSCDLKPILRPSSILVIIWSKTYRFWSHLLIVILMNYQNHSSNCVCLYSETHNMTTATKKALLMQFLMKP